jgi:hypothetical protein
VVNYPAFIGQSVHAPSTYAVATIVDAIQEFKVQTHKSELI